MRNIRRESSGDNKVGADLHKNATYSVNSGGARSKNKGI